MKPGRVKPSFSDVKENGDFVSKDSDVVVTRWLTICISVIIGFWCPESV